MGSQIMQFPYVSGGLVNWLLVAEQPSCLGKLEKQDEYKRHVSEGIGKYQDSQDSRGQDAREEKYKK